MNDTSVTRMKCAMIIFELERSIGRMCKERSGLLADASATAEIQKRAQAKVPGEVLLPIQVVEGSYLGEVIALAVHVSRNTSLSPWVEQLQNLMTSLSLFEIRNAVSHPNRPFPEFYWYRCAAIATDPCIDALGLVEVGLAFSNAQEGKIQEPPEDWLYKMRWSVPALLPSEFEHSITGLVGRSKDVVRLERELENSRIPLVALVARGGVGKTSLALQVVSDFCLSAKSAKHFDAAIWATLKQERLTADGIELLSAPTSLEELKADLTSNVQELLGIDCDDWQQAVLACESKRILLCLDNLELLLRDHAEQFQTFHESLPAGWKVLVTSRIPVDGAKNLPLDVLDKGGAVAMVRAYLGSKGYEHQRDAVLMENIATGCKFNPLAMRLTIDLYLSGREIDAALERSEQQVLAFSFTSLLETLSELEGDLLEALFALDKPTRMELCNSLERSVDEVAQAVAKLLSMSLILRNEGNAGECYSLAPSIRDLLRAYPRNPAIRSKVATWLARSRASEEHALRLQLERNVSPVALEFIPAETSSQYINLCRKADAAEKHGNRAELLRLLVSCRSKVSQDPDSSFLHRVLGKTLLGLDDPTEAITSFQRARTLAPDDPAPLFGLLNAYNTLSRWKDIYSVGSELIAAGWGEPDRGGGYYANRIWGATLRSANFGENFSEVFDKTESWGIRLHDLPALALSRASAYRKLVEVESRQSRLTPERLLTLLAKAANVLRRVATEQQFARWLLLELGRLIGDIKRAETRGVTLQREADKECLEILGFLELCVENDTRLVLEGVPADLVDYAREVIGTLDAGDSESVVTERRKDLIRKGFVVAKVKVGIRTHHKYFFAQDDSQIDYYIHMAQFDQGRTLNRRRLVTGAEVAIRPAKQHSGRAPRAEEAWFVGLPTSGAA